MPASNPAASANQLKILLTDEDRYQHCPHQFDSLHILLLEKISDLYAGQADFVHAIQFRKKAIRSLQYPPVTGPAFNPALTTKQLSRNYYELSDAFDALNNIAEKTRAIDSCIAVSARGRLVDNVYLYVLLEKVEQLFDIGEYSRCITYARIGARETLVLPADKNQSGLIYRIHFVNAEINSQLLLKNYDAAAAILQGKVAEYKAVARNSLASIYDQLAEVEMNRGNYQTALAWFREAVRADQAVGFKLGSMQILNNRGHLYLRLQDNEKNAMLCYRQALAYGRYGRKGNVEEDFECINSYDNIAGLYSRQGKFDSAFYYFQRAFDLVKTGIDDSGLVNYSMDSLANIAYISSLVINKGDACLRKYSYTGDRNSLRQSILVYRAADHFLERIKAEQSEMASKLFWRQDSRHLYEQAVRACFENHDVESAFYFFEKSRAVLLNDQLNQQKMMAENEILDLAQLSKKITRLETSLNQPGIATEQYTALQNELVTGKQEQDRLLNTIKARNPLYYQGRLDTSFINLNTVKTQVLQTHQALIEVFSADSAVYLLVITPKDQRLTRLNKILYDSLAGRFMKFLRDPDFMNSHYDDFIAVSKNLCHLLFQDNPVPAGRIIISPDGWYFPFEALITGNNSRNPLYFVNDHAVSYTYSARYLLNHFEEGKIKGTRSFLGVAPVQYPGRRMASLYGSDQSLKQSGSYFGGAQNLIAGDASKKNFLNRYAGYQVIQLFTHASDSSSYGEPVIYFSDSALYLSELIGENKTATRLIVLSACETAIGKEYKGEGVFSFNRGFAAIGIPAAISNLWSVDNRSTYRLTELFYKWLSQGLPTDEALQKAKKEFIQTAGMGETLPNYWAAAILAGKTDSISGGALLTWQPVLVIGLICLFAMMALAWLLRSKPVQPGANDQ